jgi:hypothetical protein
LPCCVVYYVSRVQAEEISQQLRERCAVIADIVSMDPTNTKTNMDKDNKEHNALDKSTALSTSGTHQQHEYSGERNEAFHDKENDVDMSQVNATNSDRLKNNNKNDIRLSVHISDVSHHYHEDLIDALYDCFAAKQIHTFLYEQAPDKSQIQAHAHDDLYHVSSKHPFSRAIQYDDTYDSDCQYQLRAIPLHYLQREHQELYVSNELKRLTALVRDIQKRQRQSGSESQPVDLRYTLQQHRDQHKRHYQREIERMTSQFEVQKNALQAEITSLKAKIRQLDIHVNAADVDIHGNNSINNGAKE